MKALMPEALACTCSPLRVQAGSASSTKRSAIASGGLCLLGFSPGKAEAHYRRLPNRIVSGDAREARTDPPSGQIQTLDSQAFGESDHQINRVVVRFS